MNTRRARAAAAQVGEPRRKLTAVVACYRDGSAIPLMYDRLRAVFDKLAVDYEIIFVNDRSPDDAADVLTRLASVDEKVVVVNHARNFGSQSAFSSGLVVATGDAVVLLDGDLQDPPEIIPDFYEKWIEGHDVVYGVRVKREASLFRQFAYSAFYRLFRAMSYLPIPLDAGDFSLLDRRVVTALKELPEKTRYIRGLRAWVGFDQVGVPYTRPDRAFGHSTNSLRRNVGWAHKAIVSFSFVPLDIIAALALITISLGLVGAFIEVVAQFFHPSLVRNGAITVIVLMVFMGGVQLLCLSILGSYLRHIYDEVKGRPAFIVDSILNDPRQAPRQSGSAGESIGVQGGTAAGGY